MRKWLMSIVLFSCLPAMAEMNMTRELGVPAQLVPGQPVTLAVTFWTDSWFNPPPQWPEMTIENGNVLTTPLPNQLVTRNEGGALWSGIRMERQVMAWDQGILRLPQIDLVMRSANQPPKTITLPALEKNVAWPAETHQPDRFLPASRLDLSQKWQLYRAVEDSELHVGDVIEREVTLRATDVIAAQIPQLLYAIPGSGTQRLDPVSSNLTQGRGEITGVQRQERLRYLPTVAGELSIPPLKLRWWDTRQQQWQLTELPGAHYTIAAARVGGSEKALQARKPVDWIRTLASLALLLVLIGLSVIFRRAIALGLRRVVKRTQTFWQSVSLPELTPEKRKR
ncbi:BatD family protein [Pantoea rwandensis]|uniref:Oxygen tolerance domain protein n=1 Tax=Pantoea rwandensis TaxID=1076550 RepID=A0A1X1D625_9GAMM|nr:BatD family protein [Pantoea rwandensis]ORM72139.1 oxygen tolerance domain protein [Pantoea rwandensis]